MKRLLLQLSILCLLSFTALSQNDYKLIADYQFDYALGFENGLCSVNKDGQVKYGQIFGGKWGFIDEKGNITIDFQYDRAFNFASNGLAMVSKNSKCGFIDKTGKIIIDFQFFDAKNFENGLAPVMNDKGYWGYIDETGKLAINYIFEVARTFNSDGLAFAGNTKFGVYKCGIINRTGEFIGNQRFFITDVSTHSDYFTISNSELIPVLETEKTPFGGIKIHAGFINKKGEKAIDFKFNGVRQFSSNGLAAAKKDEEWGFIDQTGRVVIDFQFDNEGSFHEGFGVFVDGLALVKKPNSKWGYIDQSGKTVVNFQFDDAYSFKNGIALVQQGGKWGFIDATGKAIIDPQYDGASEFSNGFAFVSKGGKWGFIDQSGKVIIDFQFDNVFADPKYLMYMPKFNANGIVFVQKGETWGAIDTEGKTVIGFQFNHVPYESENGLALAQKNNKYGVIKPLTPIDYVTEYINTEILKWQEKGKYETSEAYQTRVNENSRKKKLEELSNNAVQMVAQKFCDLRNLSTEYDADNQTFKVNTKGLPPFYVKVPVTEAESFDQSIASIQFQNTQFALGKDNRFFLQKATVKNPSNGKTYNFSSTDQAVFAYTQLNMNFEPININVQTANNTQSVKTDTKTLSVGLSEVDTNIPVNQQNNDKTFVVIIANENYSREVKVQYALNDGKVFKDYCEKTLGIPAKNIHYSPDATYGTMKSEIKWVSDVIAAFNGKAKVIFYYAGHGMPNEADKSAYLLPVDGFSSDYETAIKLDDLYNRLATNPSQGVTVFLDACFSGSIRENGMLANARGVKIRPKADALKGKMVVFSAATGDETAYPYKEKQHGLFTYFLLKKLQDTKGEVDYQTLSNYITENVKQQSIVVNQKSQTPQVNSSSEIQNAWMNIKLK
ncbi:hypothetical protein CYCD_21700 [Tenuifilaceae bacterium CYCD]|nr:hypothetical protein CYCD_21700 [Tenuifilaceae bacterium CYCD]